MRQSQSLSRISRISNVKMDSGIFLSFIPALWSMMWTPRSSSTSAVARSKLVFLLKIQFVLWTWPRGCSCIQRNAWSPVVHPVRQSTELHVDFTWQGYLSMCIWLCDHEVPLEMSPVMQATGWQIVHNWLHLMLIFVYSGEPLPTRCRTKFTTVLRGSHGVDSMGIFASSPPGGVTPHSARKVQIMPASGISSELRAHQMAPDGVVAHSIPPAGVVAHSSPPAGVLVQVVRSLHARFRSWSLCFVLHFRTSSSLVLVLRRAYEGGARH